MFALWYMSDGEVHSAKLEGSLVGKERQDYWDHLITFKAAMGAEAGDGEGQQEAAPSSS